MDINRFNNDALLAENAAKIILAAAEEAIRARGIFTLVLPGGKSPIALFKELAASPGGQKFPWDRTHIFWGDERCLPHTHRDSNFRLARELLIEPAGIEKKQLHPIPTDLAAEKGAELYRRTIEQFFNYQNMPVRFDCVILGMGADGHTASILIEDVITAENKTVFATAGKTGSPPVPRISLGYPLLLTARKIILIVAGTKKEKALRLASSPEGRNLPVAKIVSLPDTTILATP